MCHSYQSVCASRTIVQHTPACKHVSVERGSSAVECRNQVSPGSKPLCYHFEDWAFSFSSLTPQLTQLYK